MTILPGVRTDVNNGGSSGYGWGNPLFLTPEIQVKYYWQGGKVIWVEDCLSSSCTFRTFFQEDTVE